jgi:hypothetical protein
MSPISPLEHDLADERGWREARGVHGHGVGGIGPERRRVDRNVETGWVVRAARKGKARVIQPQPLGEPLRRLRARIGERDLGRSGFRAGRGDRRTDAARADNKDALARDVAAGAGDAADEAFAVE